MKDKESELKKSEQELQAKFEEMKKRQSEEKQAVDLLKKTFEEEQAAFNKQKQEYALHQAELASKGKKNPKKWRTDVAVKRLLWSGTSIV